MLDDLTLSKPACASVGKSASPCPLGLKRNKGVLEVLRELDRPVNESTLAHFCESAACLEITCVPVRPDGQCCGPREDNTLQSEKRLRSRAVGGVSCEEPMRPGSAMSRRSALTRSPAFHDSWKIRQESAPEASGVDNR